MWISKPSTGIAAVGLLALAQHAVAHSWVEQLMRIAPNGTMIGPVGYIAGYVDRDAPLFSDTELTNLIPPNGRSTGNEILATDKICKSTQSIGNYSDEYPMLIASPGDYIALRHQENGHVTLPWNQKNKPLNRGTIYIYGTSQPAENDTLLGIHDVWTPDGTGGDGRGRLIATRNFDDGQCYQINSGNISVARQAEFPKKAEVPQGQDLWCQADIQLPTDVVANSTYTLYWVWSWNTYADPPLASRDEQEVAAPSSVVVTLNETYTSCMQIRAVDPCSAELGAVKGSGCAGDASAKNAVEYVKGQDLNNAAIAAQLAADAEFIVQVPGASAAGSSTPAATPTQAPQAQGAIVTVTVTEEVATVYVTATVEPAAESSPASPTATSDAPSVSPFLSGSKRAVRRGRGEWQLGAL